MLTTTDSHRTHGDSRERATSPRERSTTIDELIVNGTVGRSKADKAPPTALLTEKQTSAWRMLFALGLAAFLVFGVMLYDELGPTFDRTARVTAKYTERHTRRADDRVIEGRDDHGGVFEIDVTKAAYTRAALGDEIVVSRSQLTGRVVRVDGPGWSFGGSTWRLWLAATLCTAGAASMAWALLFTVRRILPSCSSTAGRRHVVRLSLLSLAVAIGSAGWVAVERSNANAAGAAGEKPVALGDGCEGVAAKAETWLPSFTLDGAVSQGDIELVVSVVNQQLPSCDRDSITSAVCDAIRRPSATITPHRLTLAPATECALR